MDESVRSLLEALGDGATREHAERALMWSGTKVDPARLGGLSEVAARIGRPKNVVCNWITRGTFSFPRPIAELAATKIFDMDAIDAWAQGNPELVKTSNQGENDAQG